jgi:hypothetical protein
MKYFDYFFSRILKYTLLSICWLFYHIHYVVLISILIIVGTCQFKSKEVQLNRIYNRFVVDSIPKSKVLDSLDRLDSINKAEKKRDSLLKIELNGNCNW